MANRKSLFEMRRFEALSNTIFGVAMTLLAYNIPKSQLTAAAPNWGEIWQPWSFSSLRLSHCLRRCLRNLCGRLLSLHLSWPLWLSAREARSALHKISQPMSRWVNHDISAIARDVRFPLYKFASSDPPLLVPGDGRSGALFINRRSSCVVQKRIAKHQRKPEPSRRSL